MNTVTLSVALLMGLTGSLHCAGMCGPIVLVMPFQHMSGFKKVLGIGLYHLGRITSYALMAMLLYSFRSLFDPRMQQYVSLFAGAMLLIMGVVAFIPNSKLQISMPWATVVKNRLGSVMGHPSVGMLAVAGMLNGLLPCGLVYMALSASINTASVSDAILFVYTFGLGTVPMMVGLTILKHKASLLRIQGVRKMVPVLMFFFGCLFILRGMNLGIPYISPKVSMAHGAVKASCCHKD